MTKIHIYFDYNYEETICLYARNTTKILLRFLGMENAEELCSDSLPANVACVYTVDGDYSSTTNLRAGTL